MNRPEQLSGLFWLAVSVFVCMESFRGDVGTLRAPGPGFLPFWSAVLLGGLAIILLITNQLKKNGKIKVTDLWQGTGWGKVVWVLIALFIYTLLLQVMGYIIMTFALMTFLLGIMGRLKLWVRGATVFIIVSLSYFIFYFLLDVKLPKGIFGF